jgi:hypothetical protein
MNAILTLLGWMSLIAQSGSAADRVAKTYSLRLLRATPSPARVTYGALLLEPGAEPPSARGYVAARSGGLGTSELRELFAAASGSDRAGGGADLEFYENTMVAVATEEQHRAIAATLQQLQASAAPVSVQVMVLALAPGASPPRSGVLNSNETASFLEGIRGPSRVLWQGQVESTCGLAGAAESITTVPCVVSYGAEVAKKAKAADPWVEDVAAGIEVAVAASPLLDGTSAHVAAVVNITNLLAVNRYETRGATIGNIEQPQIAGARIASSATLAAGDALVLKTDCPDVGTVLFLLRPAAVQRKYQYSGAAPCLYIPTHPCTSVAGRELPVLDNRLSGAEPPTPPTPGMVEFLKSAGAGVRMQLGTSGEIFMTGDAAALAAASQKLKALESGQLPTVAFEFRIVRAADAATAAAPSAALQSSATLAVSADRAAGAIVGRQELAVRDFDISIAEEAMIAIPKVVSVFRGFCIETRWLAGDGNSTDLAVDVRNFDFGPRERFVSQAENVGDHERVPRRETRLQRIVKLTRDGSVVLGELGIVANSSERLYGVLVPLGSPTSASGR